MLLAVYGTLRRGGWNHPLIEDKAIGVYRGEFWTPPRYTMWDLGSYPAVTNGGDDSLYVEVYDVQDIGPIDQLEGFPEYYNRKDMDTPWGPAKYYYQPNEAIPSNTVRVTSGDWIKYNGSNIMRGI